MAQLLIGLSPWILEDGNYGHFKPGQSRKFALEFHAPELRITELSSEPSLAPGRPSKYIATGTVVFVAEKVWACDFGPVMAYDHGPLSWAIVGANVSGEVYLGVEPFDYFERHHKLPGMPALTYRFLIERILLETYPLIYSPDENAYKASDTPRTREEVATTERVRVREDRYKIGSHFVLDCTVLESGLERANRAERFPDEPTAVA